MPMYGWKPEYQVPRPKKKEWDPPPNMSPRKFLKRGQLIKTKPATKRRDPTEEESRILYEREIYRVCNLHASLEELQKQYEQFKKEKVYPGMLRAWLMNSYKGEEDERGMPEGQGSANLAGGLHYEGTFKQGLLHGQGLLKWGKGSSYAGGFYCNRLLGKGVYSWVEGAQYTGEIFDGVPHGMGHMEGEEGLKYDGSWMHGKREGEGKMTFGKTAFYEGGWKNDRKDGEGRMVFTTGSSYHGTWSEGMRHGQGRMVQRIISSKEKVPKAAVYSHDLALQGKPDSLYAHNFKGHWMGGLPHGSGRSWWPWDGKEDDKSVLMNSYIGSYENGMRHGEGSFFYSSGALFKGHWWHNMKVGLGILVYESGKLHFGVFSHDRYDPITNPGLNIREPLESALYLAKEDMETAKSGVWRAIMRHKNTIHDVFHRYCSIVKEPLPAERAVMPPKGDEKKSTKGNVNAKEKSPKKENEGKISKEPSQEKADAKQMSKKDKKGRKEEIKDKKGNSKSKEPDIEPPDIQQPKEPVEVVESDRPQSPRSIGGRSRGMSNEQFWRFLRDGNMLQPGLGCGQVDRMVPSNHLSWDPSSDAHSYTRQLILREVVLALIQIGLFRYQHEQVSSEDKIEKFFASHLRLLESVDNDSLFAKVDLCLVQGVLLHNRTLLDKLFREFLLESETPDHSIKLRPLIQFGQSRRPHLDVPSGALLAKVALEVYGTDITPTDYDKLLDQDINYKEYEVILLLFSILGEDLPKIPDGISDAKAKAQETNVKNLSKVPGDGVLDANDKSKTKEVHKKNLPKKVVDDIVPEVKEKSKSDSKVAKEKNLPKIQDGAPESKTKFEVSQKNLQDEDHLKVEIAKAKEEYEKAIADLLTKFILEEVGVYKPPKSVKGLDSKSPKGKGTKLNVKSGKE